MSDDTHAPVPSLIQPLCDSAAAAIRAKLDQRPIHPHVFDEISTFAKAVHKAASTLEPVLSVPKTQAQPIATAPASEGYGANLARQLVDAFTGSRSPKMSYKDLMSAIAVAEEAGLHEDAERLRDELFDRPVDPESLTPQQRLDRANRILAKVKSDGEEAKALLASIRDEDIADDTDPPAPEASGLG
jgi:hypothetical protein